MKITGHDRIKKNFQKINNSLVDTITNLYLLKTARSARKKTIAKTANVSGEMIKKTTAFISSPRVATVAVNVPYGSYIHEGERKDGSRKIENRTAPGQKHHLRKAMIELDLGENVYVINEELEKILL